MGAAAVDITPPVGMPFQVPQRPPFRVVPARGTHDPLHAKAVVLEAGGVRAAVVACDLTSIPVRIIAAARAEVAKVCSVPPENVMITATHTHTGPNIRPKNFRSATPEQLEIATAYLERLPKLIADSVRAAEAKLADARPQAAMGEVHGIAFNRRYVMKDGRVTGSVGKEPGDAGQIVRPAGPVDPSLPLVYFESADGKPLATPDQLLVAPGHDVRVRILGRLPARDLQDPRRREGAGDADPLHDRGRGQRQPPQPHAPGGPPAGEELRRGGSHRRHPRGRAAAQLRAAQAGRGRAAEGLARGRAAQGAGGEGARTWPASSTTRTPSTTAS